MGLLSLSRMHCTGPCRKVTWHKRSLWRRETFICRECGTERPFKMRKR